VFNETLCQTAKMPNRCPVHAFSFERDPEFARAVEQIIQECTVNVDLAKVEAD
jgi:hypothetical protein